MLSNILVLNKEVFIYNTFIISYNYILNINDFKVLILILLYKSNFVNLNINNSFIKLKVIIKGKAFIFLN
jgi:hypothetical protein